jgi:hypothetical protein
VLTDWQAEEKSFAEELTEMANFSADGTDDKKMTAYALSPVPSALQREVDDFILHRTATFAARRQGGAVVSSSAEGDKQSLLRFFGYLFHLGRVPETANLDLSLLGRPDLGDLVEGYAGWLQNTQELRFSSIANYINGIVAVTSYVYSTLEPPESTLLLDPTPLTQLINLRAQAESQSKTQNLFDKRVGGWITWPQVQQARVKAEQLVSELTDDAEGKRSKLRDCAAVSLLSLIPPDRVGLIRKLRLGHTLKQADGGGWRIDLTKQRDGHKTSRFYGVLLCYVLPKSTHAHTHTIHTHHKAHGHMGTWAHGHMDIDMDMDSDCFSCFTQVPLPPSCPLPSTRS